MPIIYHEQTNTWHLNNGQISYIMTILPNGHLGHLYYGSAITDKENFGYLLELCSRPMTQYVFENDRKFSLEHVAQEFPVYGSTDYRDPAVDLLQSDGSRISDFQVESFVIEAGKPQLEGLPATYAEEETEASTLIITLKDAKTGIKARLLYTLYEERPVIARSVCLINEGSENVQIDRLMSLSLDLPDDDYEWMQLSGAWARERHIVERQLVQGLTSISSRRGNSSHEHNPFVILKRPHTTERDGECFGISFVYSGNFLMQAEVDAHHTLRLLAGIHPEGFSWQLAAGQSFQSPEALLVYSDHGLNKLSQSIHSLFQKRLARGQWRDQPRPILINNWEATYFDFDEDKLVSIASKAKECGVELFVLDDGWFGARSSDKAGLGDWSANRSRLANGIAGLAERIEGLGMKFGLWFEPEMVNMDSDLYRAHPDWILQVPGRPASHGRYQHVLDFSRKEVVDNIYDQMAAILSTSKVSYIKWDMNRSITECFSAAWPKEHQGEIFHRYILGVYDLYERLTSSFPHILFESCASGGGRFDPGILYYAPQGWASDCSDAVERLKIQYGTSICYPISSIGSHVSVAPNHQVYRNTPLHTRANTAYFGTFGYELDLNALPDDELEQVKAQIAFMKENRALLQFGTFYRLKSPFEKDGNETIWMSVDQDQNKAIVGWYRVLNGVNQAYTRIRLEGLDPAKKYLNKTTGRIHYGDELMRLGLITSDSTAGQAEGDDVICTDFESRIYELEAVA